MTFTNTWIDDLVTAHAGTFDKFCVSGMKHLKGFRTLFETWMGMIIRLYVAMGYSHDDVAVLELLEINNTDCPYDYDITEMTTLFKSRVFIQMTSQVKNVRFKSEAAESRLPNHWNTVHYSC